MPAAPATDETRFTDLGLSKEVLAGLEAVGYETPSPIQAQIIPLVLAGRDVIGQAQTGTGKTAAFALPLLTTLDLKATAPQVLVLAPTRELAIQVAEAFQKYAAKLKGFHVLPIYGGQEYRGQLMQLKRGVHVVVGTPGRVMDHIRRGTLKLGDLKCIVLDEADEMLRMGFIDDVEWILSETPATRQVALFSATMPPEIKRIADKHLKDPVEVAIRQATATAATIHQRVVLVHASHKLEALTRVLEVEETEGVIIFVRTKIAANELAERLEARGHAAVALSGDVVQKQREAIVARLKSGAVDIVVATDVAARGLDVERISHVINYDMPYDPETYIHRIGRTGRAGRAGEAILFITPRERRMLTSIERATRQPIEEMHVPSAEVIADARLGKFHTAITETLQSADLEAARGAVEAYLAAHEVEPAELAAALAEMLRGEGTPIEDIPVPHVPTRDTRGPGVFERGDRPRYDDRRGPREPVAGYRDRAPRERSRDACSTDDDQRPARGRRDGPPAPGMERYRLEVGLAHGAKPGNIMGAIANESGLSGRDIGRITLHDEYSTVDLPEGMPPAMFQHLKKVRVAGRPLDLKKI
jgi:ATP-dependent RNA helicase DeaD